MQATDQDFYQTCIFERGSAVVPFRLFIIYLAGQRGQYLPVALAVSVYD